MTEDDVRKMTKYQYIRRMEKLLALMEDRYPFDFDVTPAYRWTHSLLQKTRYKKYRLTALDMHRLNDYWTSALLDIEAPRKH